MDKKNEQKLKEYAFYDSTTRKFIMFMCKKCKFYDNGCTKGRIIRECVKKGLKDKD